MAGNRLYGYDNVPIEMAGTTFKIRKPNADSKWVVWIHEKYDEGWGYRRIAAELNRLGVPSPRSGRKGPQQWRFTAVREVILNDSYAGTLVFGENRGIVKQNLKIVVKTPERTERIDAPHLRILDQALWERNQARFAGNRHATNPKGNIPTGLLVGNLRCAECGSRMYVVGVGGTYYCGRRHQGGDVTCGNDTKRPSVSIDDAFIRVILAKLDTESLVDAVVAEHRRLSTVRPDEHADLAHAALAAKVESLRREIANITTAISSVAHPAAIAALAGNLDKAQANLDVAEAALQTHAAPKPPPPALDETAPPTR